MTAIEAVKFARKRQGQMDGRIHLMLGNFCFLSDGEVHETTTICGPVDVLRMDSIEAAENYGEEMLNRESFDAWMIPEITTSKIKLAWP